MLARVLGPWRRSSTWWTLTHLTTDVVVGLVAFSTWSWPARLLGRARDHRSSSRSRCSGCSFVSSRGLGAARALPRSRRCSASTSPIRFRRSARTRGGSACWSGRARGRDGRRSATSCSSCRWACSPSCRRSRSGAARSRCSLLPAYASSLPDGTAKFFLFEVGPAPAPSRRGGRRARRARGRAVGHRVPRPARRGRPVAGSSVPTCAPSKKHECGWPRRVGSPRSTSAEAERRRIERDLHDGAQQRLVTLAMDLGTARERFDSDPDGARALVVHAARRGQGRARGAPRPGTGHPSRRSSKTAVSTPRSPPWWHAHRFPVSLEVHVDPRPPRCRREHRLLRRVGGADERGTPLRRHERRGLARARRRFAGRRDPRQRRRWCR